MAINKRVLVHPLESPKFGNLPDVWFRWQNQGSHVVGLEDNLFDTDYMEGAQPGTVFVYGGQEVGKCLASHLSAVITVPNVDDGSVIIQISQGACWGGSVDGLIQSLLQFHPNAKIELVD